MKCGSKKLSKFEKKISFNGDYISKKFYSDFKKLSAVFKFLYWLSTITFGGNLVSGNKVELANCLS